MNKCALTLRSEIFAQLKHHNCSVLEVLQQVFITLCARVPGGVACPAAAVAMANAEAGETEQREFSPGWTADVQTYNYDQWQQYGYSFLCSYGRGRGVGVGGHGRMNNELLF